MVSLCQLVKPAPDDATSLRERIGSIFDKRRPHLAKLGPALGVHGGPGIMGVIVKEQGN